MRDRNPTRRHLLGASAALGAGLVFARPLRAAAPEPSAVTAALIGAARREGKLSFYSALELVATEKLAKAFEAAYPGIAVRIERTGAERIFQRIAQEESSRIHAVDVVCSSDAAHMVVWKRNGWLAPYMPEDVARHFPPEHVDPDGMYATACASLNSIGYNTNLVKPEQAPKSYADLLDTKWRGRLVKGHPAYSGSILTTTYLMARELGWSYFEKLATQKVMQVQSAGDPPKKLALGERAVQVDGTDSILIVLKEQGQPVEVVYASEGTPLIVTPTAIFASAPNPNAARLFQSFLFGPQGQQILVESARHSFHRQVKEKPGRTPFSTIKLMTGDANLIEQQSEEVKARYAAIFRI